MPVNSTADRNAISAGACWYLTAAMHLFASLFRKNLLAEADDSPESAQEWAELSMYLRRTAFPMQKLLDGLDDALFDGFRGKNQRRLFVFDDTVTQLLREWESEDPPAQIFATARSTTRTLVVMLDVWRDRVERDCYDSLPDLGVYVRNAIDQRGRDLLDYAYRAAALKPVYNRLQSELQEAITQFQQLLSRKSPNPESTCHLSRLVFFRSYLVASACSQGWNDKAYQDALKLHSSAVRTFSNEDRRLKLVQERLAILDRISPQTFAEAAVSAPNLLSS